MDTIRVMLVDDNTELRAAISERLETESDLLVCAECGNGAEALLELEKQPVDVIVLDIIMPQMDGYSFLEELKTRCAASQAEPPKVIVTSSLNRDDLILRAMNLGACYYMVKPFDPDRLIARIRDVSGLTQGAGTPYHPAPSASAAQSDRTPTMDERLSSLFLTIGIPAHIKGYHYLREAVKMTVANPDIINRITKELYPGVAHRFSTSPSKVERAIRHAIEVAWSRGRIEVLNKAFGCQVVTKEDKPTNGEFIAMIADKLTLERKSVS